MHQPIPVFVIGICWNLECRGSGKGCRVLSSVQKSGLKHQILKAAGLDVVAGPDMIWKEPVSTVKVRNHR